MFLCTGSVQSLILAQSTSTTYSHYHTVLSAENMQTGCMSMYVVVLYIWFALFINYYSIRTHCWFINDFCGKKSLCLHFKMFFQSRMHKDSKNQVYFFVNCIPSSSLQRFRWPPFVAWCTKNRLKLKHVEKSHGIIIFPLFPADMWQ